jgi:outer membrane protein assembly factor BamB
MKVTGGGATQAWFAPEFGNHHGGIIALNGYIYGFFDGKGGSQLKCVNAKTGEVVWSDRSVGKGSLTCADGMLYCLSERNNLALVEATPEGYKEHGRFTIPKSGRPSWAHPVVVDGKLFIRDQDKLTCYDVKAK